MADKPDKWSILNDYGKTVITLASGLLVIAVTFSDKLPSANPNDWIRYPLYGLWIALLLAQVTGVWLLAALFGLLRRKDELEEVEEQLKATPTDTSSLQKRTKLASERDTWQESLKYGTFVSYLALLFVALCLCLLGFGSKRDAPLVKLIAQTRIQIASLRQQEPKNIQLLRLILLPPGETYRIEFSIPNQVTPSVAEIDAKTGEIRSLH